MVKKKVSKKRKAPLQVYLLVADETQEFQVALLYTAHLAVQNGARVALLHVMDQESFQNWGGIEERLHNEYLEEAEGFLCGAADVVKKISGQLPALYLQEGGRLDIISDIIQNDHSITKFILGGSTKSSNPGPLVSYFTGKGFVNLRVPLTVVPDSIDPKKLD